MVNLPNFLKYGRDAEIQLMHKEDTIVIKKKKIRIIISYMNNYMP
jgi:hypothetical protein